MNAISCFGLSRATASTPLLLLGWAASIALTAPDWDVNTDAQLAPGTYEFGSVVVRSGVTLVLEGDLVSRARWDGLTYQTRRGCVY